MPQAVVPGVACVLSGEAELVACGRRQTFDPVEVVRDHMGAGKAALIADPGEMLKNPGEPRLDRARGTWRSYAHHPFESGERGDGADIGVVLDLCEELVCVCEFPCFN